MHCAYGRPPKSGEKTPSTTPTETTATGSVLNLYGTKTGERRKSTANPCKKMSLSFLKLQLWTKLFYFNQKCENAKIQADKCPRQSSKHTNNSLCCKEDEDVEVMKQTQSQG